MVLNIVHDNGLTANIRCCYLDFWKLTSDRSQWNWGAYWEGQWIMDIFFLKVQLSCTNVSPSWPHSWPARLYNSTACSAHASNQCQILWAHHRGSRHAWAAISPRNASSKFRRLLSVTFYFERGLVSTLHSQLYVSPWKLANEAICSCFIRRTIVVFGTLVPWSHCKYCNAVGFGFCGAAARKLAAHLTRPQEAPFIRDIRV